MPQAGTDGGVTRAGVGCAVRVLSRCVGLPVVVGSPALKLSALADCTSVVCASADGGKSALRGVSLPCLVRSPTLDLPALADRAGVECVGADGGVAAIWGVALPVCVRSPTLDLPCVADCASVRVACVDGGECARWRGCLPCIRPLTFLRLCVPPGVLFVASPALDLPARTDRAGVQATGADGGEPAFWGVGLPVIPFPFTASPALDLPARTDRAGVQAAGADGGKAALRGVGLPGDVPSPALDRAVIAQAAGVHAGAIDGGEVTLWGVALPVSVRAPTLDLSALADHAGMLVACADGDVARRGGADRDLRAPQPSPHPRVGREVARLRRDPLPIRRRERELNPAVLQQPRVDPADLRAADLHGAAAQPAVYRRIGREIARARQHPRTACRLPTELDATIF